ncbi:hypothetical protein SAY86_008703 [Trapa natans]|uniref:Uncharacterized protein n=1 Tax=Trapa natans TaxID=22666 RepID=A0AAN7QEU5_TRANT|nr:hypothetical protein SAY86_008703 [Trapa natans]
MRRMKVIMLRVLLAWLLLLAASGRQFPAFVKAQATVHTNSKLQPGQHQIYVHSGNIRSTKEVEEVNSTHRRLEKS